VKPGEVKMDVTTEQPSFAETGFAALLLFQAYAVKNRREIEVEDSRHVGEGGPTGQC
jgi:hypothetical protein